MFRLAAALGCLVACLAVGPANAQQKSIKDDIVGAWSLVAVTAQLANGSSAEPFGANPKGMIIFTPDGHFALFQSRSELPKLAAACTRGLNPVYFTTRSPATRRTRRRAWRSVCGSRR